MGSISDMAGTTACEQERRVLVVDGNSFDRAAVSALLDREGCRVTQCPDGATAVAAAEEGTFDAILIDYTMPDLNGAVVTVMLRQRHLRVNIIGMSMDDRSNDFIAAGADVFLMKPFDIADLLALLRIARTVKQDRRSREVYISPDCPPHEVILQQNTTSCLPTRTGSIHSIENPV